MGMNSCDGLKFGSKLQIVTLLATLQNLNPYNRDIFLGTVINALWYICNEIRHYLYVKSASEEIKRPRSRYQNRQENHPDTTAAELYTSDRPRRLQRKHLVDEIRDFFSD